MGPWASLSRDGARRLTRFFNLQCYRGALHFPSCPRPVPLQLILSIVESTTCGDGNTIGRFEVADLGLLHFEPQGLRGPGYLRLLVVEFLRDSLDGSVEPVKKGARRLKLFSRTVIPFISLHVLPVGLRPLNSYVGVHDISTTASTGGDGTIDSKTGHIESTGESHAQSHYGNSVSNNCASIVIRSSSTILEYFQVGTIIISTPYLAPEKTNRSKIASAVRALFLHWQKWDKQ
jgi:hypothetical protein